MSEKMTTIKAYEWGDISEQVERGNCIARVMHKDILGLRAVEVQNVYINKTYCGISHSSGYFTAPLETVLKLEWQLAPEAASDLAAENSRLSRELEAAREELGRLTDNYTVLNENYKDLKANYDDLKEQYRDLRGGGRFEP